MQVTSTFWAAIHSLPRAELAIIPTMKEDIQGYHMNPNYKRLVHPVQRNLRCHVVATVFLADGAPLPLIDGEVHAIFCCRRSLCTYNFDDVTQRLWEHPSF